MCTGAGEDHGDSATAGQKVDLSHGNHSQAQAQASNRSQKHLLRPSQGSAEVTSNGDRDVRDAGFNSMPRKLKTIVSGEPVMETPTAEEVQASKTHAQGLSTYA